MNKMGLLTTIGISDKTTKYGGSKIAQNMRLPFNEFVWPGESHLLSLSQNVFILHYELVKVLVKTR